MKEMTGALLVLLALVAPSGLAWLIARWLSRKEVAGQRRYGP